MTDKNYSSIVSKLTGIRKSIASRQAFEGLVDFFALVLGILFILWLLTWIFWPGPAFKIISLVICVAGLGILAYFGMVKPLIGRTPLTAVAIKLEKYYGKLQSRLIASLELYDKLATNRENYSIELIEKTIDEAGAEIKNLDFGVIIEKSHRPYRRLILAIAMFVFAFFASFQTLTDTFNLYSHPFTDIPRPTHLMLAVSPILASAVKNDNITVKVTASGEKIRGIDFNFKYEDGDWAKAPIEEIRKDSLAGDSVYSYTFKKIKRNVEFFAQAKNIKSPSGQINVIDPPRLIDVAIRLDFPSYTRLPSQDLPSNEGSITALKGTIANFKGAVSKPIVRAVMVFADSTRKKMTIDDRNISGQFPIRGNSNYHIEVVDSNELASPNPINYDIVALDDYPPRVTITFPAIDIDLDDRMQIPIQAEIYDDFGFSKLELVFWKFSEGKESEKTRQTLRTKLDYATEIPVEYNWGVEDLALLPGDLVYYYLEVFDNDIISGPKSAVSKTFSARLPSLDEIVADITGNEKDVTKDIEQVSQNQKQLKEELDNIAREMMKASEVDYENKQQIQGTINKQKEIAQKLEEAAKKMQDNIDKFDRHKMATQDMLDKMQEIQQLMEKVATPEMKEAMRKLEEAMKQMDPEKLKQALKDFQLDVEQMNKNLDRTLALLKKFELEQKFDTMAKMAEKLAEQQEQINQQLNKANSNQEMKDLQKPQLGQKQGLESLKDQFKEAKQMNQELKSLPEQDMQQAEQQLDSQQMQDMMNAMMQNLQSGNKSSCKQSGGQMQKDFQEMAQMFQSMLKKMQSQQQAKIVEALKKAISDVLYLSQAQEDLADSTKTALRHNSGQREMAKRQQDLQSAAERLADKVSDLTKETLFVNFAIMEKLGQAMRAMQNASNNLSTRQPGQAPNDQTQAMAALNQSAMMLMKSSDQASSCPNGSGMNQFMQQLSQLGQMQANLNQQMQSMMPMPFGQAMSALQQQQLGQMAAQQEAIRKSLEEMTEANGDQGNVLGRLDQLGKEMKQVADEMKKHNVNQSTIERQEAILSRLLDAQKSVNRRDYTQKRQAENGKEIIRRSPGQLNPDQLGSEQLSEDIKRALGEKYPRRYENLIKEYFKALSEDKQIEK